MKCPFNPDRTVDNTPETQQARKKLLEMYAEKHGARVVEKADG